MGSNLASAATGYAASQATATVKSVDAKIEWGRLGFGVTTLAVAVAGLSWWLHQSQCTRQLQVREEAESHRIELETSAITRREQIAANATVDKERISAKTQLRIAQLDASTRIAIAQAELEAKKIEVQKELMMQEHSLQLEREKEIYSTQKHRLDIQKEVLQDFLRAKQSLGDSPASLRLDATGACFALEPAKTAPHRPACTIA